ncbi:MAG: citrate/2-methylcitrate synthase [Candidatus Omnitrophota bacterium]
MADPAVDNFSKGLQGVVAARTKLSHVDGENGRLSYLGIPITELAKNSCFEEVVYLLRNARLPKKDELESFKKELAGFRAMGHRVRHVLEDLPWKAHPMGVLKTMVGAYGLFDPEANCIGLEFKRRKALRLTAVIPTIIASFGRLRQGLEPIPPRADLSHAANFIYMLNGQVPTPEMEKALDTYLILLADHGLNASTFSARVTISTESDLFSAITSAIGTLKGDLHGSANQRVMEMFLEIGDVSKVEPYVEALLAAKKKVMGFGHRIYKKVDPRSDIFREIAKSLCEKTGNGKWYEMAERMEKYVMEKKGIPCNVDFYSAPVLYVLGFPVDFFTTVFAASRVAGWTAHVIEQFSDNRLIRPEAHYIGPEYQPYTPIAQRA